MANLKEVRNRITSVNSTKQITSAMKMVSAAKLKRAQNAIVQMRPYANKLQEILSNLSSSLDDSESVFSKQREVNKVLLVPITSNRGLCGGFNNNVIKEANHVIANTNSKIEVFPIGKKANDFFSKTEFIAKESSLPKNVFEVFDNLNFSSVSAIAQELMGTFENGSYDKIILIYNKFKNAAVQILQNEQFLPLLPTEISSENSFSNDYLFEPNQDEIVENLIPKSLKTQLYKALLDSNAAEHGARMTAMHMATDNANELEKELKLMYNKARQAAITNEILEIVGGAEALNS